jgi:hypothetical protein
MMMSVSIYAIEYKPQFNRKWMNYHVMSIFFVLWSEREFFFKKSGRAHSWDRIRMGMGIIVIMWGAMTK